MDGAFSPLRSLGEGQLQIQFTLSSTYDTQAMGLLGLNAALAAAAIAGSQLLGQKWWLTLAGFALSSLYCGAALATRGDGMGPDLKPLISRAPEATGEEMDRAIIVPSAMPSRTMHIS